MANESACFSQKRAALQSANCALIGQLVLPHVADLRIMPTRFRLRTGSTRIRDTSSS